MDVRIDLLLQSLHILYNKEQAYTFKDGYSEEDETSGNESLEFPI
jgi:hypothetical protein